MRRGSKKEKPEQGAKKDFSTREGCQGAAENNSYRKETEIMAPLLAVSWRLEAPTCNELLAKISADFFQLFRST